MLQALALKAVKSFHANLRHHLSRPKTRPQDSHRALGLAPRSFGDSGCDAPRHRLVLGACVVGLLATAATGLTDYWRSFAQNTAADLIGAIIAMYVLIPLAQRPGPDGQVRNDAPQEPIDDIAETAMHADQSPGCAVIPPAITPDDVESPAETTV